MMDKSFHMTASQFREEAKKLVDWMADYYEQVEKYPVLSQVQPGEIMSRLPENPPEIGEPFDQVRSDIDRIIMPGITHWQSPGFYAYFPSNTSFPSIMGEMVSACLGVQGMIWATSPAATELETRVLDWLAGMLGLPRPFFSTSSGGGVIQDTASSAALTALVAAREKATNFKSNDEGPSGKMVAYVSSQTHSSVEKAVKIAGIGRNNLRVIAVDHKFALIPGELQKQITEDKAKGLVPFFVCATIGTTSSTAVDPVELIGEICKKEGIWLHVDAAMAGTALICPEFRQYARGLDLADSFCFNPHKWMFTNFDCNCFWVADRRHLTNTFSILPEYLRNKATESGEVFDYRDWHIQLGRRFRSLKLWMVIRHYGKVGLQYHIRNHVEMAKHFAEWVGQSQDFELITEPLFNLVCFRYKGSDQDNLDLMNSINRNGEMYFTHTKLNDRIVLRLVMAQTATTFDHLKRAIEILENAASEFSKNKS